jgi:hypothetical protein
MMAVDGTVLISQRSTNPARTWRTSLYKAHTRTRTSAATYQNLGALSREPETPTVADNISLQTGVGQEDMPVQVASLSGMSEDETSDTIRTNGCSFISPES